MLTKSHSASASLSPLGRFTLLTVACLTIMVGTVVAPGLAIISSALGVASHASWLITLPALGVILFAPFAGRLIDRVGAYSVLQVGLASYGLLGMAGAMLTGPALVFVDRILLGAATAVVMVSGTSLISHWYQGHARLKMLAQQGMAIELGGVVFLLAAGILAGIGWAWPFTIYLLAWLMLLMLRCWVPKTKPSGDEEGSTSDTSSATNTGMLWIYMSAAGAMMLFFTLIVLLPLELSGVGLSERHIGFFLAGISLVAVVAAMLLPRVARQVGENVTLTLAFANFTTSLLLFGFADDMRLMISGAIFAGVGFGFSIPLVNHMTVERTPVASRGRNLAYLSMAIFSGQFLTSLLEFTPGGARQIFGIMAAVGGVFTLIYLLVGWQQRSQGSEQPR